MKQLFSARAAQYVGLAVLVIVTLVLCYLAVSRNTYDGSDAADPTSLSTVPSTVASTSAPSSTPSATDGSSASEVPIPDIAAQVSADFAAGDPLPPGAQVYSNPAAGSGLALTGDRLGQAVPAGDTAVSTLEVGLDQPVQRLSARLEFPGGTGTVVLVGWQRSFVAARTAGDRVPRSGLRLEVDDGSWRLGTYIRSFKVLASGEFPPSQGAIDIAVYRDGTGIFVVDPSGDVTEINAPLADALAGPWAAWQLVEDSAGETPAQIDAISAG